MPRSSHSISRCEVLEASVGLTRQPFRSPLVLSSGSITDLILATAQVRLRVGDKEATGLGSIYLSDLWAWPAIDVPHGERETVLSRLSQIIAQQLPRIAGAEPVHPLELGLRLHHFVSHNLPPEMDRVPVLARAMCASPFDAAIHDAAGKALSRPAMELFDIPSPVPAADQFFKHGGACAAVAAMLRKKPLHELAAWLIVGKNDDLERDVKPWVVERRYKCFKLKIMGSDAAADAARTAEVYARVRQWGVEKPRLSVDSNEANPDAGSVLEYLDRLDELSPAALAALQYLEQPTGRDIREAAFDWAPVTARKPVLLDEGLDSLDLLVIAHQQGWSGLALKTCKGHSFALIAAAWAYRRKMPLSLQDLTNPGYSLIHAAIFSAYVPTINGAELNSPQFTPAANQRWSDRYPELFQPRDGLHRLPERLPVGLGSEL